MRRKTTREESIILTDQVDQEIKFVAPAPPATVQKVASALRANNMAVEVVATAEEARRLVLDRIPLGAEVHSGKSKTLRDIGVFAELFESGRYDSLRTRTMQMDRQRQGREIRKLVSAPDIMVGSVNAVTEDGLLVTASATAGQIGPYASGAGQLILVVGSQKIVPDLDAAFRRIAQHVFPYEDADLRARLGSGTFMGKVLIMYREWIAGRVTVVLVQEPVGV